MPDLITQIRAPFVEGYQALAAVNPLLPWALLPVAHFVTVWAIRRWWPSLWLRIFRWLPPDADQSFRRATQAFVSGLPLAIVGGMGTGMVTGAVLGLFCASFAPLGHHLLRWAKSVPYQGELGGAAPGGES